VIGVTIDDISSLDSIVTKIEASPVEIVRLCCDPGETPAVYKDAVASLTKVCKVMIQPVDSSEMSKYSRTAHMARFQSYIKAFGDLPNVWGFETGNEINGDWLGEPEDVCMKVNGANSFCLTHGIKSMVTMYAMDQGSPNQVGLWLNEYPIERCPTVVSLSIYENSWENPPLLSTLFDEIRKAFPSAITCIGEFGTEPKTISGPEFEDFVKRWYTYQPTEVSNYQNWGMYWDAVENPEVFRVLSELYVKVSWVKVPGKIYGKLLSSDSSGAS
jgi:hypothetical protein